MTGIEISIDPIIFRIGALSVSWHGFFMVVGIVTAVWMSARLSARDGLSSDRLYNIALFAVPGGIIGARLIHVIDYWDFYAANPASIIQVWNGGLALYGGILGGALTGLVYAWIKKFDISPYADRIAPGMILAQAIGRIGDVINGEHFSKALDSPLAVYYSNPNSPAFGMPPSHLAVGYELIMDLLIFALLWKLLGRLKPDGTLFLLYLAIYSTGRFFLSFLRLDSHTVALGLNQPQWIAFIVIAGVLVIFFWRRRKHAVADVSESDD